MHTAQRGCLSTPLPPNNPGHCLNHFLRVFPLQAQAGPGPWQVALTQAGAAASLHHQQRLCWPRCQPPGAEVSGQSLFIDPLEQSNHFPGVKSNRKCQRVEDDHLLLQPLLAPRLPGFAGPALHFPPGCWDTCQPERQEPGSQSSAWPEMKACGPSVGSVHIPAAPMGLNPCLPSWHMAVPTVPHAEQGLCAQLAVNHGAKWGCRSCQQQGSVVTPGSQGSLRAAAQGLGRGAPESRAWMMALHCWGLQAWLRAKLGDAQAVQRGSEWR